LSPEWHLYFALMIAGTLIGMKILSLWEDRISEQTKSPSNRPRKRKRIFPEEINLTPGSS